MGEPLFLDPHQSETLEVLAERFVPGSSKAQVNQFIDLLRSVDTSDRQKSFLNSLGAFEAEAIGRYNQPYKDLTGIRQNEILTTACKAKPGAGGGQRARTRSSRPPEQNAETGQVTLRDHFEDRKGWVVGAYYSSEVGMKELGWTGQVMFESFPGCQHPGGHD